MRFSATVRVTTAIDFEVDVPEAELELVQEGNPNKPTHVVVNEAEILAARADAAATAERLARERYGDASDILVEEVVEL
jgi:hypothetical protein